MKILTSEPTSKPSLTPTPLLRFKCSLVPEGEGLSTLLPSGEGTGMREARGTKQGSTFSLRLYPRSLYNLSPLIQIAL